MARAFDDSTSNYLRNASAPSIVAAPLSFSARINATAVANAGGVVSFKRWAAASARDEFLVYTEADGRVSARTADASGSSLATTTSTISAGLWAQIGGRFGSATSRFAVHNGVSSTEQTTSRVPAGIDTTLVGVLGNSSAAATASNAALAEIAAWNIDLAAEDWLALANGWSPAAVKRSSLVYYWRMFGVYSPEIDLISGYNLTITGVVAAAPHCPVIHRTGNMILGIPQPAEPPIEADLWTDLALYGAPGAAGGDYSGKTAASGNPLLAALRRESAESPAFGRD